MAAVDKGAGTVVDVRVLRVTTGESRGRAAQLLSPLRGRPPGTGRLADGLSAMRSAAARGLATFVSAG